MFRNLGEEEAGIEEAEGTGEELFCGDSILFQVFLSLP